MWKSENRIKNRWILTNLLKKHVKKRKSHQKSWNSWKFVEIMSKAIEDCFRNARTISTLLKLGIFLAIPRFSKTKLFQETVPKNKKSCEKAKIASKIDEFFKISWKVMWKSENRIKNRGIFKNLLKSCQKQLKIVFVTQEQ